MNLTEAESLMRQSERFLEVTNQVILKKAYNKFLLPLGGKKVPTPYRLNEMDQNNGPQFQGKSSPEILNKTTKDLAKEQRFNLEEASVEEIREFMIQNKLGIDCSGFVYRVIDFLLEKLKKGDLQKYGFDHVGRTNAQALTSDHFSDPVGLSEVRPADLIKVNSSQPIPHVMVVLEVKGKKVICAHSSDGVGVHLSEIEIIDSKKALQDQRWEESYYLEKWSSGDGVRRLKLESSSQNQESRNTSSARL